MGNAEERKEPTFPLSYWQDTGDIELGPLPDRLKRPERSGEEQAREEVAPVAPTVNDVAERKAATQAKPKSQEGPTPETQEVAPPQPEAPSSHPEAPRAQPHAPPARQTQALTLGQELQAKYPLGVTLRTDLEFEEFAYYVDYVRQVRELRNRPAGNRPRKRQAKVAKTPPA